MANKISNKLAGDVACLGGPKIEHQPRLLGSQVRFPAGAFAIFPFLPKLHFQFPFPFLPFLFLSLSLSLRPFVCAKNASSHIFRKQWQLQHRSTKNNTKHWRKNKHEKWQKIAFLDLTFSIGKMFVFSWESCSEWHCRGLAEWTGPSPPFRAVTVAACDTGLVWRSSWNTPLWECWSSCSAAWRRGSLHQAEERERERERDTSPHSHSIHR